MVSTAVVIRDDAADRLAEARVIRELVLPNNNGGFWSGDFGPYGRLLVAVRSGEVVGYLLGEIVMAVNEYATVHELAVTTDLQDRGVGTALLHRFAVLVANSGCDRMYVKALPGERRVALQAYYAARGFTKREVEQGHQRAPATRVIRATGALLTDT